MLFSREMYLEIFLYKIKKSGFVKNRFIFYLAINFPMWITCYEKLSINNHVNILWFAPILLFSMFSGSYFQGAT